MEIISSAFGNSGLIPKKYTCDGEGISPPLTFSNIPPETVSLALIVEDPDVPKDLKPDGVFDHLLVWDMPDTTMEIEEGATLPGIVGENSAGEKKYAPACPPDTSHRYFFRLYALDAFLKLSTDDTDKKKLLESMEGHIIEKAELMGVYEREKKSTT